MHEAAIAQSIIDEIRAQASCHGFSRVRSVHLKLGRLNGAVPASLDFAFGVLSKGTPAEGATISVQAIPLVIYCTHCHSCGLPCSKIVSGRELTIEALEVD
jgi:hydrogenase nickel incorporation protein HypA/HybF